MTYGRNLASAPSFSSSSAHARNRYLCKAG